jgi:hypothetical protein
MSNEKEKTKDKYKRNPNTRKTLKEQRDAKSNDQRRKS